VSRPGPAPIDERQLFLVGLPRTGSTLLRHVLNRSPQVTIASETHFMARARRLRLGARLAAAAGAPAAERDAALRTIASDLLAAGFWPWLRRNVAPDELERRLHDIEPSLRGAFGLLLELYADRTLPGPSDRRRVVGEKTPEHLASVPVLARWFPEARFVHTIRDPRGVYASRLRRAQQGEWGLKARLPWLPAAIANPVLPPIEAAYAARSWNAAARADARLAGLLGERYALVRFEDLVASPEATVRRVCDFAGIAFSAGLLADTDIVGSSFANQRHAGSGFDPTIADRWRREVPPFVRRLLGAATREQRERLGYRR
jgi:hypothetical protein